MPSSKDVVSHGFTLAGPPLGFVKVNWDAAVDSVNRRMGIGVIIRSSTGEVLATLSALKSYIINPLIAEATAALRAVTFSRDLGFPKVMLEGDALVIVQALQSPLCNFSSYGHLIEEARSHLNSLHSWRINHVRRHLNGAAHRLAKVALTLTEDQIHVAEVPQCISEIIAMERCT
ncbi:hypothetical protein SLA2020_412670 [Shorea laevis]